MSMPMNQKGSFCSDNGSWLLLTEKEQRKKAVEKILSHLKIKKENNPDLFFLSEEGVGIDQVRKIKKFLSLKQWQKGKKTVVILWGETLTLEAQNALLKTLEEKQTNRLILIGGEKKEEFLPTIISRCRIITLKREKKEEDASFLEKILSLPLEERFLFLEQEIKLEKMTPEEGLSWLKENLKAAQKKLVSSNQPLKWKRIIRLLEKSKNLIEAHLSPKTAIDWFILNL